MKINHDKLNEWVNADGQASAEVISKLAMSTEQAKRFRDLQMGTLKIAKPESTEPEFGWCVDLGADAGVIVCDARMAADAAIQGFPVWLADADHTPVWVALRLWRRDQERRAAIMRRLAGMSKTNNQPGARK